MDKLYPSLHEPSLSITHTGSCASTTTSCKYHRCIIILSTALLGYVYPASLQTSPLYLHPVAAQYQTYRGQKACAETAEGAGGDAPFRRWGPEVAPRIFLKLCQNRPGILVRFR